MPQYKNLQIKITKGMNQDLEGQSFNPSVAFKLLNMKNQVIDANGQQALTNEKGTEHIIITSYSNFVDGKVDNSSTYDSISGYVIGTIPCTQYKSIVFTKVPQADGQVYNYIYKIVYDTDLNTITGTILAKGYFNFGEYISGIFCYENSELQKVYWVDGANAVRYINTADSALKAVADVITDPNLLDSNPSVKMDHHIVVERQAGGGTFTSGVVQYAISYYRENGPETGIIDVTPMYYIAEEHRGITANETAGCSFKITIQNPDTSFDYLRVYQIQRTSLNGTPIVRIVKDIKLN